MCAEPARVPLEIHFPDLHNSSLYLNRELSHLEFQRRVLEEARDPRNPLLERVKFLSILGSNLDEFFMVRVAGLMQQIENGVHEPGIDGRSPAETLEAIRTEVGKLMEEAYDFLRSRLLPALSAANIHLVDLSAIDAEQRAQLDAIFIDKVFQVLTPLAFDPGRPFPHISNLSLNLAVVSAGCRRIRAFRARKGSRFPAEIPSINLMSENGQNPRAARLRADRAVTHRQSPSSFSRPRDCSGARIPCNARRRKLAIKELETDDLLETIEEAVWQRRFRDAVRLQVDVSLRRLPWWRYWPTTWK